MNYWRMIELFDEHLDANVGTLYKEQPFAQDWARISKVAEELGEAVQVFIGYTGQNPRKGSYGSQSDLMGELADVAATAILAMQHFLKDITAVEIIMYERASNALERVGLKSKGTEQ
jgi:hypothetical protein